MVEKIKGLITYLEGLRDSYKEDIKKLKEEYKSILRLKSVYFAERKITIKEEINDYLVIVSTLGLVLGHIKSLFKGEIWEYITKKEIKN